ncbi:type IV pilus secretin PilQ [Roseateles saccharophilus]|uniref:Type IV pilus biogenesis and competence protein PilQ n=1 Tax=Roseateles saccharophilus TaxID=304 RepID=A0A4R3UH10_ROSSA|nr:type IV pilus secretin PilQ [Roseateles saccharophilus]MDG0834087.1 type IV pilus secretin PilQ [Roseateles saccharophilus]TCU90815.1 type IV pilus assembly protein PilQ [Roseateles saccharophilus]
MKTLQENKSMGRGWLLGFTLALLGAPAAWAAPQIQAINMSQQAGVDVVRIELSEPLAAVPTGFTIQSPPRVAIDLPGVGNAMGHNAIELNQGNLRSANVAQAGDRARVVLNLRQASNYQARLDGNALVISLGSGGAQQAQQAPGEPVHFAQSLNAAPQALRDIDFRRGAEGTGRVIVNLPSNQVGVDIQQQGQSLVVEFLRSSLPENLRRKIDVTDFGTPVQMITTTQTGDRVRMVVEPKGNWEHSAYQSDNQFVLEVRPQKVDPNKLTQGPGFAGDKLSLNFQNIEVRALLQVIADFTNFNVVTSDTVTGSVTLRLKDVPWDQALDIIMQAKGLGLRKSGNVLWIAPKDELAAKEKLDLESKAAIAQLEPVRSQAFQLNYVKAEEIAKSLNGQATGTSASSSSSSSSGTKILSARGSVFFEPRTNQLFVSDIPSKLEEIQAMIAKIDVPVRQVLIEARIVEANDKFGRSLGVKLGANDLRGQQGGIPGYSVGGGNYVTIGGNYNGVGSQTNQGVTANYNNTQFINLPANVSSDSFSGGTAAQIALSLFSATANRFLNLELSALESDGKGKVVSSPRIITADQVKAVIEQGEELPYQVATASGATSIAFRKANLKLEVTPQITPEGSVILNVDVNKDSRGTLTPQGYAINTKHAQTQVLVENGGTVVIGGIYTQDEGETVNKVPLLGDVPLLGNLFKNKVRTSSKTELLIFLTPKVVSERTAVR